MEKERGKWREERKEKGRGEIGAANRGDRRIKKKKEREKNREKR